MRLFSAALVFGLAAHSTLVVGAAPSIEEFAARPRIEDASIAPDGRHLVRIQTQDGNAAALVEDRTNPAAPPKVVMTEPDHFRMTWCRWATNTRLLCGFLGMARTSVVYAVTRLAAVDADGKNLHMLIQNDPSAQGQFQDRIVNWNPGPPDTVLIEADEGLSQALLRSGAHVYGNVGTHGLPAVFELNVVTGHLIMRQAAREPIRHWIADNHGQVRLGWGLSGATRSYYARLAGDHDWRRLSKFEFFTRDAHFDPIAISDSEPNKAYAYGPYEGRTALWMIDLTDQDDPTILFSHPAVDVGRPLIDRDGALLSVHYETGYPMTYFTDEHIEAVSKAMQHLIPGKFSAIRETTQDGNVFLVRSYSDFEPPSFIVLDTAARTAVSLGKPYPQRDVSSFAAMRSISYPARDGTIIAAYLSTPPGAPPEGLPLIVMPHGGPIARDDWRYFFLTQFLVSRGYAVLQMNFRGSAGYGADWFFAAHQDWGGLTYDDVVDGARWAVRQRIADPSRMCIVGWSFGGYLALVGAQRNADLFRCAVDIAGVSDLTLLIDEMQHSEIAKRQIGMDSAKLKLNSPRRHAAEFNVPLLMIHGEMDAQVPIAQSEEMDSALRHAGKAHKFVSVPGADHPFSAVKDRALLLGEVEAFLGEHLARHP